MSSLNNGGSRCSGNRGKRQDMSRSSRNGGFPSRGRPARPSTGPSFSGPVNCSCTIGPEMQGPQINGNFLPPRSSRMDNNMAWITNDLGISNIMAMSRNGQPSRRKSQDPKPPPDDQVDERFLIKNSPIDEENDDSDINAKQKESILEWFDRNVEQELMKRRESVQDSGNVKIDPDLKVPKKGLPVTDKYMDRMAESGATGIEIETKLRLEPDSELSTAVDKLAMAEAMISFAGAVKAAEAAVELAPPDKAEEAAVEGVKLYHQTNTTVNAAKEVLKGSKPVEIIGYIGVTKPKEM